MLRGAEVLRRNFRRRFVDLGSMLAAQSEPKWRRNVHSYVHLLDKKHEWELEKIRRMLVNDPATKDKGTIIGEYTQAVSELARLKSRLAGAVDIRPYLGLPSLTELQQTLAPREAFVSYFPTFGGIGRLCVNHEQAVFSVTQIAPELPSHVQKLQEAVATEPTGENGFDRFPFASAVAIYSFLFGGLDKCLPTGTVVTVALPPEFAGIPLGALLKSEPTQSGSGYNPMSARWLVRDLSFSVVTSARHYLTAVAGSRREAAPRPFLGIGNPTLDTVKLASSEAFQRSVKTRNGVMDFQELPETIEELKAVGGLFAAPESDILLGKLATEEAFRSKLLGQYDVIHFATHGLLKDDIAGLTN